MFHFRSVLKVWEDIENHIILPKSVNFVATNTKKPKEWLLLLEATFNLQTWNLFKILNTEIS